MDRVNKIYAFFIGLALLFWNPLTFYLVYRESPAYSLVEIHLAYWLVFLFGGSFIYILLKGKLGEKVKNALLMLSFTGILFSILVMVDGLAGITTAENGLEGKSQPEKEGLIFEPHSRARYETVEFDYVAEINNLGLRDRDIEIDKAGKYRILCFGDSWTFGWGVAIEDSWPRKLEAFLHSRGFNGVEVINCGQGGQYSTAYRDYMEKAVPLLKPDLVLVGMLQGDDLAQLYENSSQFEEFRAERTSKPLAEQLKQAAKSYLKASFSNLLEILKKQQPAGEVDIRASWRASANNRIKGFNYLQKIRFHMLPDSVRQLFRTGDLNSGLLGYYIDFPERMAIFNDPNHPATSWAVRQMNQDVQQMKAVCEENQGELAFVNLPINYFTGHKVVRTPSDVLNPYLEQHNHVDSIYRTIAVQNRLPYLELTERFRSLEEKDAYFFTYDGHPNEKGYQEIAHYIGEQLIHEDLIKSN